MSDTSFTAAHAGLIAALGAGVLLVGCADPADTTASLFAQPGKYVLYQCQSLKQTAKGIAKQQYDLEQLTRKAGNGPAGQVISSVTYEPEYVQARGELNEIRREAAAKHCDFVHGVDDVWVPTRDAPAKPKAAKPAKR